MNNLYYIENANNDLLNMKVKEILKEHKLTSDKLIMYDMDLTNISVAIMDLDTYSLFNDTKVIVCKNSKFLTSEKSDINHDIESLQKYLNNPNPNNILILSASKLDGKKNIAKLVKEKCQLITNDIDLVKYIKAKVKGYEMDNSTITYFLSNTMEDLTNIDNELDKLMAYTLDTMIITKKEVDLITIKKIDCNIYELIDAIISKNKKKSLEIYEEMTNYGEDIFKIFVLLANQIRLIYQVKTLSNLTNDEICQKLNLKNVKQVSALRYKIDKYHSSDLVLYLHKLSLMDEALKKGTEIDKIVFPIFIASL